MPNVESFEVQGTPYDQSADILSSVKQIAEEYISPNPGFGFQVRFMGENQMVLTLHVCEIWEPHAIHVRRKEMDEQSEKLLNDYEKHLKKEYKSRVGKSLRLKELKDDRSTSIERVSLNDRYYFRSSRMYDIS